MDEKFLPDQVSADAAPQAFGVTKVIEAAILLAAVFGANIALARVVDVTLDAMFR